MNKRRLILASLVHHRRLHAAVALGVLAATTVLTGALLVGSSVRGSLRQLALDRLGSVNEVLVTDRFFRAELAAELAASPKFQKHFNDALPAILTSATLEKPAGERTSRAGNVSVIGCGKQFWSLGSSEAPPLAEDEIVLNEPLAQELGAAVGDRVLLRIPLPSDVPGDTPLGTRDLAKIIGSRQLTVSAVIPAEGLGRFGLHPSQQLPRNAYVLPETLQSREMLDVGNRVNTLLIGGPLASAENQASSEALRSALQPTAADYGLVIESILIGPADDPVNHYINITSEGMLLPQPVVDAAQHEFGNRGLQPALTYLANTIQAGGRQIPYSTVTGINPTDELGPYQLPEGGKLGDDQIVLNSWAADQLGASPGDEITLTYYDPETSHGKLVEPSPAPFRLRAITRLAPPKERPTKANDPHLAPELKGVTDQQTISQWDLPFELVEDVNQPDEDYWDDHNTTPKAFVSLSAARRLWASRFGDTTSLRIPAKDDLTPEAVFARLDLPPAEMGFVLMPVKRLALAASTGATDFNLLFIGFSFFIIAAAVMLVALLFRLGVEQRAREIGIEAAVGLTRRQIRRVFATEGLIVASTGALLGAVGGTAYAWLMLLGLRTWWLPAVGTPFLNLHIRPGSVVLGVLIGLAVCQLTIWYALRRLRDVSVRELLAGQASTGSSLVAARTRWARWTAGVALLLAFGVGASATQLGGQAQAGAFFSTGGLMLLGTLLAVWAILGSGRVGGSSGAGIGLGGLAIRNAGRNPLRSTLTIGLVAAASFLIVAISAFRLDTSAAGTGGYELIAETDKPVLLDLNSDQGRYDLAFSDDDNDLLTSAEIYSLRVRSGTDASCLNLYSPQTRPRVLGLSNRFIERGGFAWSSTAAETQPEQENPWLLLQEPLPDGELPVVIDMNTATYSLHLYGVGSTYEIQDDQGDRVTLRVVGLLNNSVLQGSLLLSEENFLELFPYVDGHRMFLIDAPAPQAEPTAAEAGTKGQDDGLPEDYVEQVRNALESTLGDFGFAAQRTEQRLAGFLAVQNTYLSTFQSLGALGLLLGTFGLATVQLRSVLERRGELALMRAAGFRRSRLAGLVLRENCVLLIGGLAAGVLTALVAVLPHMIYGGASVPWQSLAWMLGTVLIVGLAAGMIAVYETLRAPLIGALRGE